MASSKGHTDEAIASFDVEKGWLDLKPDEFDLYLGDRKATRAEKTAALKAWRAANIRVSRDPRPKVAATMRER